MDQLADLWPRIRQDVKALNRRIEALLASVDPVRVSGNVVILAAAYPFHRDKLNTDDVRTVVEAVISRLAGREITVQCALRDEVAAAMPAPRPTTPAMSSNGQSAPTTDGDEQPAPAAAAVVEPIESTANPPDASPANGAGDDDEDGFDQRLQAARNIFDAELIDPPKD